MANEKSKAAKTKSLEKKEEEESAETHGEKPERTTHQNESHRMKKSKEVDKGSRGGGIGNE